jgi:twinkle protein
MNGGPTIHEILAHHNVTTKREQDQIVLERCFFCEDEKYHFYISLDDENHPWYCHKCGEKGNLITLRRRLDMGEPVKMSRVGETIKAGPENESIPSKSFSREWAEIPHDALLRDEHGALTEMKKRGLTEETVRHFKIGVTTTHNGKESYSPLWQIPYYTAGMFGQSITCVKYRTIPPADKKMWREAGMDSPLYNAQNIDYAADRVILCEGEFDAMALWQVGHCNVVSTSTGAKGFKPEWIQRLSDFKQVILCYDGDSAGQSGTRDLVRRLGEDRCYVVNMPKGEDANDILIKHGDQFLFELVDNTVASPVQGVERVSSVIERDMADLMSGDKPVGLKWMFPSMCKSLGDVEQGSLWVVVGRRGVGKTTLIKQQMLEWAKEGTPTLFFCGEMTTSQVTRWYVQSITGTAKDALTPEIYAEAYRALADVPLYTAYPTRNSGDVDCVIDMFDQAYSHYGVQVFAVDNLMTLTGSARDVFSEQGRVVSKLKDWAVYNHTTVVLIAHPRKLSADRGPRGLETAEDVAGSAMIMNYADGGFTVFREMTAPLTADDLNNGHESLQSTLTHLIALKAREAEGGQMSPLFLQGQFRRFVEATPADERYSQLNQV